MGMLVLLLLLSLWCMAWQFQLIYLLQQLLRLGSY
jgi:hypothetical protein